jgi:hypothetical protein
MEYSHLNSARYFACFKFFSAYVNITPILSPAKCGIQIRSAVSSFSSRLAIAALPFLGAV